MVIFQLFSSLPSEEMAVNSGHCVEAWVTESLGSSNSQEEQKVNRSGKFKAPLHRRVMFSLIGTRFMEGNRIQAKDLTD